MKIKFKSIPQEDTPWWLRKKKIKPAGRLPQLHKHFRKLRRKSELLIAIEKMESQDEKEI